MAGLHLLERLENRLGGRHAGLHRRVRSLDLRDIQEAGRAADKTAAREGQLRDRLETALVQRPRAIGDTPPAFKHVANGRMRLEALEFLERRQVRVCVIKPDNIADGNLIAVQVIEEGPAIGVGRQRPADRMPGRARLSPFPDRCPTVP